jgi:ribonucleotide reductase beta subunit family protein with ferritin-like domain
MIDTLISDPEDRRKMFNAMETIPSIKKKAEWALKWMGEEGSRFEDLSAPVQTALIESSDPSVQEFVHRKYPSFAERLVAFAAVEGIFFSASFCAIYWIKQRGMTEMKNNGELMPGVCSFNHFIARDEGMHQYFASLMYKREIERDPSQALSEEQIMAIVGDAVEYEKEFATTSLPVRLMGMNSELMCQHIEAVADRLLNQLGCPKMYHSEEPFKWFEMLSMNNKTNFFERRPTEYSKFGNTGNMSNVDEASNVIKFDTEF